MVSCLSAISREQDTIVSLTLPRCRSLTNNSHSCQLEYHCVDTYETSETLETRETAIDREDFERRQARRLSRYWNTEQNPSCSPINSLITTTVEEISKSSLGHSGRRDLESFRSIHIHTGDVSSSHTLIRTVKALVTTIACSIARYSIKDSAAEHGKLLPMLEELYRALLVIERPNVNIFPQEEAIDLTQLLARCKSSIYPFRNQHIIAWKYVGWESCKREDLGKFQTEILRYTRRINKLPEHNMSRMQVKQM